MKNTSPNYDENYNNVPLPLDGGGLGWATLRHAQGEMVSLSNHSPSPPSPPARRGEILEGFGRKTMRYRKIFLVGFILFLGLPSFGKAEDYSLQYFLSKASSKTLELSKKEKTELVNQLEGVVIQAQKIRTKLIQGIQTGETDVRYQEGKFWLSKLEEDQKSIETGIQQIKLLREKPTQLIASIQLYKSLKDLSSNFNAYNNMPSFSAWVGDLAPEMELWADPVFYKLYLFPLARSKDTETKAPQREKKPVPKEKMP